MRRLREFRPLAQVVSITLKLRLRVRQRGRSPWGRRARGRRRHSHHFSAVLRMSTMVNLMRRAMLCQNGKSQGSHSPMHLVDNPFHNRAMPKAGRIDSRHARHCIHWLIVLAPRARAAQDAPPLTNVGAANVTVNAWASHLLSPFVCFPGLCLADLAAAPSSLVVPHLAALAIGPGQRLRTTHQVAGEAAVRGMTS